MPYPNLKTIQSWCKLNAPLHAPEREVAHLLHDSRSLTDPARTLFVALRGNRHDGHQFITDLYRRGVRAFLVQQIPTENFPEADFLPVPEVLAALRAIAADYRRTVDYPVLGVTGSNGKTTVKEWLRTLLAPDLRTAAGPGSWNSQVGVPLSVYRLHERADLGIVETGISQRDEMETLAAIVRPDWGLFTHLGPSHAEGFASEREKLMEKSQLFRSVSVLFYGGDQEEVHHYFQQQFSDKTLRFWSRHQPAADLLVLEETTNGTSTHFRLRYRSNDPSDEATTEFSLTVPFTNEIQRKNTLHCVLLLCHLGIDPSSLSARFRELPTLDHRLRIRRGVGGSTLIDDTYSFDLHSFRAALETAMQYRTAGQHLDLVLGDPHPQGVGEVADLVKLIERVGPRRLYLLESSGDWWKSLTESTDLKRATTEEFLANATQFDGRNAVVLVKGRRHQRLERIVAALSERMHQTVLEVDLSAMIRNLHHATAHLPAATKTLVMVKANAYGAGALETARQLAFHRVDYLGVAFVDEGVRLRRAGIEIPVLVLNPDPAGFENLVQHQLEPEIFSLDQLRELTDVFARTGQRVPLQLKIETGMHRLGFADTELDDLLNFLRANPGLRISGVFTHLAAADDGNEDEFTRQQIATFTRCYERIIEVLGYRPLRHVLNSAGIARFPEAAFEMVRLGIGLYQQPEAALRLRTTISQLKTLEPGATVGYGRRGKIERTTRVATVGIGYGDGIPRLAGLGKFAPLVRGQRAPILGAVCMDMCMLDVTDVPDVQTGDDVVFFGSEPPIAELAAAAQTISYEILTGISERVKRVYVGG